MYKTITNAKIVTPEKIINGNILIENGKISQISPKSPPSTTTQTFDAKGKYVLPGLIEVHGHMREPGFTTKEDVPHGTRAAAAGGFTTIIDMPNTSPPTTTVELLKEKIEQIYPNRSYTDYAFFFGVSKENLDELEKVDPKNIVGFKVFMAGHETTPTTIPDDATLDKVFSIAAKRNVLLAVHAEDQVLINEFDKNLKQTGRNDPSLWSQLRSKEVVIKAIERAIIIAKKYENLRLYLLHLSSPEEFNLVSKAKKSGMSIYGEIVSYQLLLSSNDYKRLGNKIKVAPALRSFENQQALWKLIKKINKESHIVNRIPIRDRNSYDETVEIDTLCSEHTPHEWKTKNQPDVWKAQSGMPNIQETLPALITEWVRRFGKENLEEGLMTISKLSSQNPARIFGFGSKGEISIGKDADLVVLDPEDVWEVKKKDLFSKCGWSAYEGMTFICRPVATFLGGNLVYNKGEVITKPRGKWLR